MQELLTDVSPELVEDFAQDFFAGRGRKVLHDSTRWRVLDTWIGNPPELHRQVVCTRLRQKAVLRAVTQQSTSCEFLYAAARVTDLCCVRVCDGNESHGDIQCGLSQTAKERCVQSALVLTHDGRWKACCRSVV